MKSLNIGDNAPDFKGKNQDGKEIKLADFRGKNLILYFYPKDNTPGCAAESCNLRDNHDMWLSKGYEVLGVSPDNEKSHQNFIAKHNLPFNLISDTEKVVLKTYNAWGEKKMYGRTFDGVIRKTYVINGDGVIEQIFEKVKTKDHTNQILNELK